MWWAREVQESRVGPLIFLTPYTWSRDTYTHPDAGAVGAPGGAVQHLGLFRILEAHFVNTAPLAHPNYKQID